MRNSVEDLSVGARRSQLTELEAAELSRLLDASADERVWHEAGLRFDAEDASDPHDAQMAERLLARLQPPPARRRARPVWLLLAAALLVASVAAALAALSQYRRQEPVHPLPLRSTSPIGVKIAPLATSSPSLLPAPAVEPSHAAASAPLPSATELLSAAGQARRQGQVPRAIGLLETLRQRFPASAEAQASAITLGMLRLESGAPAAAFADFDGYLQRSPQGARAADALWGRALCELKLGRRAAAKTSLQTLLERYPGSSHVSAARAKLGSLP